MVTSGPTIEYGPIATSGAIAAERSTIAVGMNAVRRHGATASTIVASVASSPSTLARTSNVRPPASSVSSISGRPDHLPLEADAVERADALGTGSPELAQGTSTAARAPPARARPASRDNRESALEVRLVHGHALVRARRLAGHALVDAVDEEAG
jgi:hypothetical protein